METKTALITGITGQDGSFLAEYLLSKNYEVYGMVRRLSQPNLKNIRRLIDKDRVTLIGGDLADQSSIVNAIKESQPDELYNLAAQSFVGESWNQVELTLNLSGLGAIRVYEAARMVKNYLGKDIKIYQASSSEMYGLSKENDGTQNENTPMHPRSPYAVAKLMAHEAARVYRESYGMWISTGICFNHSGPRRGIEFVSRKISDGVARIKLGMAKELVLGNINTKRDWSYAGDMVEGMWMVLNKADKADDFVLASGESHSVKEFAELAFDYTDLNWELYTKFDKRLERPAEIFELKGDCRKARDLLGWVPKVSFRKLVELMVDNDLRILKNKE